MKETKFRAWDKENKRFTDSYAIGRDGVPFSMGEGDCDDPLRGHSDLKNLELMQYTGLKDKNGKEIYEGDIVKYEDLFDIDRVGYIYWEAPTYVMRNKIRDENIPIWKGGEGNIRQWKDGTNDWESIENLNTFLFEVIGNIYENEDLLK